MGKTKTTQANFSSPAWNGKETNWLMRMTRAGKNAQEVADALNKRYHGNKKVRTARGVAQRRVKMGLSNKRVVKEKKGTSLARRKTEKVSVTPRSVEVVETEKRLFAFQTPDLQVQIQIEGSQGTDDMLKKMAASILTG